MPRLDSQHNEHLIQLVTQHRELWDPADEKYKDVYFTYNRWRNIAAAIGEPATAEDCKKTWRYLRDTYVRKRREYRQKQRQGEDCMITWPLYNMLSFLDDFIVENSSENNISAPGINPDGTFDGSCDVEVVATVVDNDSENERIEFVIKDSSTQEDSVLQAAGISPAILAPASVSNHSAMRQTKKKSSTRSLKKLLKKQNGKFEAAIMDTIMDHQRRLEQLELGNQTKDLDAVYFDFCAHRYSNFTSTQKALFQMKVAQVFIDIEKLSSADET
ncbi:hypothetical protein HOLleu_12294 [Holothuria leucospilota]|uniref:MADF domain-containing protein n=1 Tax=Holothuria leucospilota TaxID=206669 RepID=A0A9Q1CAN3_HOLLE|nr:hypothetical protein HOLleu_12294 [Holothuria leucospilota]